MILVVQCQRCSYQRQFSVDLCGRKFRCPKCKKGALKVPQAPPGSATLPKVQAGNNKGSGKLLECAVCKTVIKSRKRAGVRQQYCPDCRKDQEFSESQIQTVPLNLPSPREVMKASKDRPAIPFFVGLVLGVAASFGGLTGLGYLQWPLKKASVASIDPKDSKTDGTGPDDTGPGDNGPKNADKDPKDKPDPGTENGDQNPKKNTPVKPDKPKTGQDSGQDKVKLVKTAKGLKRHAREQDFLMEGKVFTVLKVVDGDTMHIDELPNDAKVRLLGVDTPETKHATKGIQFWGKEASAFTKKTLNGQKVVFHIDIEHQYGVFGRPLVYIELLDGRDFNGMLIEQGFARVTKEYPFNRMQEYLKLEVIAKKHKRGMWDADKRKVFDDKKRREEAAKEAKVQAKLEAERKERQRLIDEALAAGGRYIHGQNSKVLHEPFCKRRPKKSVVHRKTVEECVADGMRKHSCFKKK